MPLQALDSTYSKQGFYLPGTPHHHQEQDRLVYRIFKLRLLSFPPQFYGTLLWLSLGAFHGFFVILVLETDLRNLCFDFCTVFDSAPACIILSSKDRYEDRARGKSNIQKSIIVNKILPFTKPLGFFWMTSEAKVEVKSKNFFIKSS